ncbi:MAG TPA: hypothetical protein VFO05_01535 [Candidatus Limnocylindrales bacterium]|nr:hypothetical protein [Candidatus Limnocylindrales bacterium]
MRRITASIALALILCSAFVAPAAAGEQRPFQGRFTGSGIAVEQRCGQAALTLGFAVQGELSHLGRVTGSGTNCTEFTLGTGAVPIWDGLVTLVAADGSTLLTTYEGGQGAPSAGVATFAHEHVITGGTGRFAGASGRLSVGGVFDLVNGTVSGTVAGWIRY